MIIYYNVAELKSIKMKDLFWKHEVSLEGLKNIIIVRNNSAMNRIHQLQKDIFLLCLHLNLSKSFLTIYFFVCLKE